jgi:hypothetical protein
VYFGTYIVSKVSGEIPCAIFRIEQQVLRGKKVNDITKREQQLGSGRRQEGGQGIFPLNLKNMKGKGKVVPVLNKLNTTP